MKLRSDVIETAQRMLSRYSSAKVASEMAHFHGMDYALDDQRRAYWFDVRDTIDKLARERRHVER